MKYLNNNETYRDCAVVAIYNALVNKRRKVTYERLKEVCLKKGWFTEEEGFKNSHLHDCLKHFGVIAAPFKKYKRMIAVKRNLSKGRVCILIEKHGTYNDSKCHVFFSRFQDSQILTYNVACSKPNNGWRDLSWRHEHYSKNYPSVYELYAVFV